MRDRILERDVRVTASRRSRRSALQPLVGPGLLFLTVWLLYGLLIQVKNLHDFSLQQTGVEAIVERGQFYLEEFSTPELQPTGDVFRHNGHQYAAKQPGQFMAGALVYAFLRPFGVRYQDNFNLAAALVTFLTGSLVTAGAACAVFLLARRLAAPGATLLWPLGAALAFALGTTALSYAGLSHHDAMASGYLVIALALLSYVASMPGDREGVWPVTGAGFLLGLTITTSMLPALMALCAALSFLTSRKWRLTPCFVAGGIAGLLPLLIYDAVNFGNPFLLPNLAGQYRDTYFSLNWANCSFRAGIYAMFVTWYAPIAWGGLAGLVFLPRRFRREQVTLLAMMAVLLGYVTNINTFGDCQYGPRYLLPAMPLAALGLVGFSHLSRRAVRVTSAVALLLVGLFSMTVNIAGAIGGAMNCGNLGLYAFPRYLTAILEGRVPDFPLGGWLAAPLALSLVGLILWVRQELSSQGARCDGPAFLGGLKGRQ